MLSTASAVLDSPLPTDTQLDVSWSNVKHRGGAASVPDYGLPIMGITSGNKEKQQKTETIECPTLSEASQHSIGWKYHDGPLKSPPLSK